MLMMRLTDVYGFPDKGRVIREILHGDDATGCTCRFDDVDGDASRIQRVSAVVRNPSRFLITTFRHFNIQADILTTQECLRNAVDH